MTGLEVSETEVISSTTSRRTRRVSMRRGDRVVMRVSLRDVEATGLGGRVTHISVEDGDMGTISSTTRLVFEGGQDDSRIFRVMLDRGYEITATSSMVEVCRRSTPRNRNVEVGGRAADPAGSAGVALPAGPANDPSLVPTRERRGGRVWRILSLGFNVLLRGS